MKSGYLFHIMSYTVFRQDLPTRIRVDPYFRDFPLGQIHPQAKPSAIAANCAARQGAYWDMHHGLFENQKRLGPELYQELAKEMGLDVAAFEACLEEPAEDKKVDQELAYGKSLSIQERHIISWAASRTVSWST